MKAIVYQEPGRVEVCEVEKPTLVDPTDAIVRVTASSICGSDLHVYHGHLGAEKGLIIGHEFVGVVDELGDHVHGFNVGDRVLVLPGFRCGTCDFCKADVPMCPHGGVFGNQNPVSGPVHGGQAEYVRVPYAERIMFTIPDTLSDDDIIFATDVFPTAYTGAKWGDIQPGDTVAVYGCGAIGICAQLASKMFGCSRVIAVDKIDYRLKVAEEIGSIPVNAAQVDPPMRIRELTGGFGADVVIEAVGARATLEASFRSARPRGNIAVIGVFSEEVTMPANLMTITSNTIRMGLAEIEHFRTGWKLIESGQLDLKFLITHTLPLADGARAYEIFDKRQENVLKILLKS